MPRTRIARRAQQNNHHPSQRRNRSRTNHKQATGLLGWQQLHGNRATGRYLEHVQRYSWEEFGQDVKRVIDAIIPWSMPEGRERESNALKKLYDYAVLHGDKGPLGDDQGFDQRLIKSVYQLRDQMAKAPSFKKMPARLKAIVFSAEQLNLTALKNDESKVANKDLQWMNTEGGPRNPHRKGSTKSYGSATWKCNKMVADAYASEEGAGVKKKYPFYSGGDWGFQANDLALKTGKQIKHFPFSELVKLAKDGKTVVEIEEFDEDGKAVAKYELEKGVFQKYIKVDDKWEKTLETKNPDELEPGANAQLGDIVAFRNIAKGESGHTGLTLGNDLFISALNSTEGVGILSIKLHLNSDEWDHYDRATFRSFK